MDLIYLDYNCFQRSFDDRSQIRIQLESLACEEIFSRAEKRKIKLVWSFMHEDENILCPFVERKKEVARLAFLCQIRLGPDNEIHRRAKAFQKKAGLSSKDAVHLACAGSAKCSYFITCDDELIKRSGKLDLTLRVMNPIDYLRGPN